MTKIRIISDIHGCYRQYDESIWNVDYSVQVGDLGFDYEILNQYDPNKHKFFPGNHDNYDKCFDYPHCLGNYGNYVLNDIPFFFVRGGFSLDWPFRIQYEQTYGQKIWWAKEQLDLEQMHDCLAQYKDGSPEFVLTHEAPREIAKFIGKPTVLKKFGYDPDSFTTNTQELLQECFEYHQPKLWICGHYHLNHDLIVNNTRFICQQETCYLDVNDSLEVMGLHR